LDQLRKPQLRKTAIGDDMNTTKASRRDKLGPRLALISLIVISFSILAFLWSKRNIYEDFYMIPLWALFLSVYLYWGLYTSRLRGFHFALLPIALIAAIEIVWGSFYHLNTASQVTADLFPTEIRDSSGKVPLLQTKLDEKYAELFDKVRFFSDGFRALALPPNVHSEYFNTNEDGFRTRPRQPKPPGVVRIALLGGSAMFGWQAASDDATLAARLEAGLNEGRLENGPRYEIVNFGVPAGNSFVDRSIVAGYADPYQVDALLFVTGNNDLYGSVGNIDNIIDFATTWMHHNNDAAYLAQLWMTITRIFGLRVIERVHVFSFIVNDILGQRQKASWVGEFSRDSEEDGRRYVAGYFANMETIFQMAQHRGIPTLVVEQPTRPKTLYDFSKEPADPSERSDYMTFRRTTSKLTRLNTEGIAEIIDQGDKLAQKYGFRYIDGNEAFRGFEGMTRQGPTVDLRLDGPLYISGTHYTLAGAQRLANYIVRRIRGDGLLKLSHN
jgi:hypothetical protein